MSSTLWVIAVLGVAFAIVSNIWVWRTDFERLRDQKKGTSLAETAEKGFATRRRWHLP